MRFLLAILTIGLSISCSKLSSRGGKESQESMRLPMKFEPKTFGRFIGTLKHDRLNKEQIAKLDFIAGRVGPTNRLQLKAVLSLSFGGFESTEYVSYHYEDVEYDLITAKLVFNQSDQQLSLVSTSFSPDLLIAEAHAGSTRIGTLTLTRDAATPTLPVIGPVAGEYGGSCDGRASALHVWTTRTTSEAGRVGNPFGTYIVSGSLGDVDSGFCGANTERNCVVDVIRDGSYDFYAATMHLTGKRAAYECAVDGDRLDCGRCQFQRIASGMPRRLVPAQSVNALLPGDETPPRDQALTPGVGAGSIAGQYSGYLHHERLDVYQRVSLDIRTFQDEVDGAYLLVMAATAKLYFGADDTAIPYSFNRQTYDLTGQVFLFERVTDDVDAIIQVTELGDGKVHGVWHSLQFGRVGTFELLKDTPPALPAGARTFAGIGGAYRSGEIELNVVPRLNATPVNSLNPFSPMAFGGFFRFPGALSEWVQIVDGSYDFYTGKIGFNSAREDQVVAGDFDAATRLLLVTKPSRMISSFQEAYAPDVYVIPE